MRADGIQRALAGNGYAVLRDAVDQKSVAAALRLLNLAIRFHGLRPEEIDQCQRTTFFPHLRWERAIWDVLPQRAAELLGWQQGDDWAEPQLLLRFPDDAQEWPLEPHVDEVPEWAEGRPYRGIVGVALTDSGTGDGTVCVWPGSHAGRGAAPQLIPLRAGDALLMHPRLGHSGTLNAGPSVRYAVYFRLLAAPGTETASSSA